MPQKTVRELGGEIWAALNELQRGCEASVARVNADVLNELLDVSMGVLARHIGSTITDDPDLPVEPWGERAE